MESSELKRLARLSLTIFLTVARNSLNLVRRASVGDDFNFRRAASFSQLIVCIILPFIQGGEFRPLIFLVGMCCSTAAKRLSLH